MQGRDFTNNWLKIEYGDSSKPSVAFFAGGNMLGWGGIFAGTRRLLEAVRQQVQSSTKRGGVRLRVGLLANRN